MCVAREILMTSVNVSSEGLTQIKYLRLRIRTKGMRITLVCQNVLYGIAWLYLCWMMGLLSRRSAVFPAHFFPVYFPVSSYAQEIFISGNI